MRSIYFYRKIDRFTGGHMKVRDYYDHASRLGYRAAVYLSPDGRANQILFGEHDELLQLWKPWEADILFVEGLDWLALVPFIDRVRDIPVINLVQHPRHFDQHTLRNRFLPYPAHRIYVSSELAELAETHDPRPTGTHTTILNGIAPVAGRESSLREIDCLVYGVNAPKMASQIAGRARQAGKKVHLHDRWEDREHVLELFSNSTVTIMLPEKREGFFLPALEAMSAGCLVICPDCLGNRSFSIDEQTCLVPAHDLESIWQTYRRALKLQKSQRKALVQRAMAKSAEYTLARERDQFNQLLCQL